ncbi:hypothetical protein MHPYR_770010 [uncultured Mycobacterium sp.]|uniref:Uncharacterized protein n=1 Tax=uncultured Mycobacterium sp. TaxID=171292 RepID=A0A1Y5PL18_9MYCO|nr:hypothetical protein MHPYR_770010 [uncultured Mycobacterium sp.]
MCGGIDARGEPGDHHDAALGEAGGDVGCGAVSRHAHLGITADLSVSEILMGWPHARRSIAVRSVGPSR